jgi:hypothetical protein
MTVIKLEGAERDAYIKANFGAEHVEPKRENKPMTNIYDQHDKAFSQVSASIIIKDGAQVGTIAWKYPKDGAGRLWCYFHIHGQEMVRAYAGGYGYDKKSASLMHAIDNSDCEDLKTVSSELQSGDPWRFMRDHGYELFNAI